jgi:hypothetical protein
MWVSSLDHQYGSGGWRSVGGALVLSLQMQIVDKVWDRLLVDWLNDLEQHVTQYSVDQAHVAKTFFIKFINACFPFFYLAYVQPTADPIACGGDCRAYLRENLMIVFATYITFGVLDVAYPLISLKINTWKEARSARRNSRSVFRQSLLEQQVLMDPYTGQDQRDDYLSCIFPVAFVMMFGTMLPSMVFLAFFALASQIRTHAWKLAGATRRMLPIRAEGIGLWDNIITIISYVAIFNCIALLISEVDGIGSYIPGFATCMAFLGIGDNSSAAKVILFFVLENCAMIFKLTVDQAVSNVTPETKLERKRQEVQRARLHEKSHPEFHEEILLKCPGDSMRRQALDAIEQLRPGHELYVEPFV